MARGRLSEVREETRATIEYLEEYLAAARELDSFVFRSSRLRRTQTLLASFSKMHELVHNADVHISKAGECLVNDAALNELNERTKRGAA